MEYDIEEGYEPFEEVEVEGDCYDTENTDLLFISQTL